MIKNREKNLKSHLRIKKEKEKGHFETKTTFLHKFLHRIFLKILHPVRLFYLCRPVGTPTMVSGLVCKALPLSNDRAAKTAIPDFHSTK